MDLEVVGRHALLFDDDSMAAFVNSSAALVEWNTLLIDRYDVRHLLSSPLPPRSRRRRQVSEDSDLSSELDHERYLDLPADSPSPPPDEKDLDNVSAPANSGGFHAVPFSYGNSSESNLKKNADIESGFRPPFAVPESLNLPPTEKIHQIIARTALFVSKHGGQSEIVLRVKQGGNPTFGFLMPDHHLHPYFRFLVDHQELLMGRSFEEKNNEGGQSGGALSLLGSVYGTEEDEDTKNESVMENGRDESVEGNDTVKAAGSEGLKCAEGNLASKEHAVSKHPLPVKDKASVIKRNPSVATLNVGDKSNTKIEGDTFENHSASADKPRSSVSPTPPKFELPIVEPPADLKRVIDKIVEFILRNGKEFEAILAEQDVKYGRFPFLLPASLYHPYYRKVLQEAEKPKSSGKGSNSEKQAKKQEKKANVAREGDKPAIAAETLDDFAKKEKFMIAIGKPKKGVQDEPAKPIQPQIGVRVDANAAAAILQAARRGIKNPNLGILSSSPLNDSSQVLGSSSYPSSSLTDNVGQTKEQLASGPTANSLAKTAALAVNGEADSSEAGLTKEQKLKAERLKRAKMFVAMIKGGADPLKAEPARSLSVEPSDSGGISGSGTNAVEPAAKEREGSSAVSGAEKKSRSDDFSERRSKRKYRSRSGITEDEEKEEEEEEITEEEDREEAKDEKKRSSRNRHSDHSRDRHKHNRRHSEEEEDIEEEDREETKDEKKRSSRNRHSDHNRDWHKHKRRHSSKDRGTRGRHKHDLSSDEEHHKRFHHRHEHGKSSHKHDHDVDPSDEEHQHRHRSSNDKHADFSDDGHRHRHRSGKRKYVDSSDDNEHGHRRRSRKHRNREGVTADEDITSNSGLSKPTDDRKPSREASVNLDRSSPEDKVPSEQNEGAPVSDELRAKIRAMLMGTLL